jgi:hypothetical protein
VTPRPDLQTVANVAALLATMAPDAAGDGIVKIIAAIEDGMVRRGWPAADAQRFSLAFGQAVAATLRAMVRAPGERLH